MLPKRKSSTSYPNRPEKKPEIIDKNKTIYSRDRIKMIKLSIRVILR